MNWNVFRHRDEMTQYDFFVESFQVRFDGEDLLVSFRLYDDGPTSEMLYDRLDEHIRALTEEEDGPKILAKVAELDWEALRAQAVDLYQALRQTLDAQGFEDVEVDSPRGEMVMALAMLQDCLDDIRDALEEGNLTFGMGEDIRSLADTIDSLVEEILSGKEEEV